MKSIKNVYSGYFAIFMLLIAIATAVGAELWIAPKLLESSQLIIEKSLDHTSESIVSKLNRVEAQQKTITQLVATLSSDQIEQQLPALVDQYGDNNVFGGGIWPLPNKRENGREKFSSFVHRDASNKLVKNTYWNSAEAPNYFDQVWHKNGQNAPKGQCAWAPAYKDSASVEARTNCSMGIYKDGSLYGVATIDVTLGFFDHLAAKLEKELKGYILIIEDNGKILNNTSALSQDLLLKNAADLSRQSPFIKAVNDNLGQNGLAHSTFFDYDNEQGETASLYIKKIPNTPWSIALSVPKQLLTQDSNAILSVLATIQIPLLLAIIAFCYFSFRRLTNRLAILGDNIDQLSLGNADLTKYITIQHNDEVGNIGDAVNRFIVFLNGLMVTVTESSQQISGSLSQVQDQTNTTEQIMQDHAKETEQVVAAISQMNSAADQVAKSAADAALSTKHVSDAAAQSKLTVTRASDNVYELLADVEQTVANVASMAQDTQQIGNVLNIIGDIAEQTNLLALNAAIEAARAGEQGRGFSVVADEVRALAARTQHSTSEINTMLTKLNCGVNAVVEAMDKTKQRCVTTAENTQEVNQELDTMVNSVSEINDLSIQIATAAEEQSAVSEEISRNMHQIRTIVEELTGNSQNTTQSTTELSSFNDELKEIVGKFKLQ